MVSISSALSCLCFPAIPPFFFKDSDFLIKYPSIDVKSLHSFPPMLLSGDSQEDTNGASILSFFVLFFFSGGFNSSLVDHILSSFQMFSHVVAPLNLSPLAIHLFGGAEDISEGSSFHSRSVQPISRLLSYSSHLTQPAQSIF